MNVLIFSGSGFVGRNLIKELLDNGHETYVVTRKRVVTIRTGVVLGNKGALNRMVIPFKFFIGGPLGTGNQWFPWIHIQDLTSMIRFIIENQELTGPINATAPSP